MGTPLDTIYATEDRDLFRQRMQNIGEPVARSTTISLDEDESVTDFDEEAFRGRVEDAVDEVGGLPVISRTTYTLGGSGSGVVDDMDELVERVRKGLRLSRKQRSPGHRIHLRLGRTGVRSDARRRRLVYHHLQHGEHRPDGDPHRRVDGRHALAGHPRRGPPANARLGAEGHPRTRHRGRL